MGGFDFPGVIDARADDIPHKNVGRERRGRYLLVGDGAPGWSIFEEMAHDARPLVRVSVIGND